MDKSDLAGGHTLCDEFLPDVLIDRKGQRFLRLWNCLFQSVKYRVIQRLGHLFGASRLGCGNVAKHQLGQLFRLSVPPDLQDIVHALVDFCAGFVRQHGVDDALVQPQLAAIRGDFQHIVG